MRLSQYLKNKFIADNVANVKEDEKVYIYLQKDIEHICKIIESLEEEKDKLEEEIVWDLPDDSIRKRDFYHCRIKDLVSEYDMETGISPGGYYFKMPNAPIVTISEYRPEQDKYNILKEYVLEYSKWKKF